MCMDLKQLAPSYSHQGALSDREFKAPFIWRKVVPGRKVTRATLGEPTFHTFPYKNWRTVYMRNKKLARLEG